MAGSNPDYVLVNNKPYVMGRSAERHGVNVVRTGASRYERNYYGVLLAGALYRLFDGPVGPITLFASHPPADKDYRQDLADAAIGEWLVQVGDDARDFYISEVFTYDEPVGGLINRAVSNDLQQDDDITSGDILVIDIGGGTTSIVTCNPNGQVDYGMMDGFSEGIISVMGAFEKAFRQRYLKEFREARQLEPARVRQALQTGIYAGGGRE